MRSHASERFCRTRWFATAVALLSIGLTGIGAQPNAGADVTSRVREALLRLPYYGVFDFLAFSVDRGTVTLAGYAYRASLLDEAQRAVKRVRGVDEVINTIEALPASLNDDRIRWATFSSIYTDAFLSRYAPGGAMAAQYDALQFTRFPGMQPLGMYPIHIVVKGGRTVLLGVIGNESDKRLALARAREVPQVFGVTNELRVSK